MVKARCWQQLYHMPGASVVPLTPAVDAGPLRPAVLSSWHRRDQTRNVTVRNWEIGAVPDHLRGVPNFVGLGDWFSVAR